MVMASLKVTDKLPFKHVYFNATVCDKKGKKFSKTLGNGIDPIEMIDKYGADAVRFTAISLAPLGGRTRMAKSDFETGSKFINKLWNASRFLLQHRKEDQPILSLDKISLETHEKWLITQLKHTAQQINSLLESYRVNEAVEALYHYFWKQFCDWGIESVKDDLKGDKIHRPISVLLYSLEGILRLAHPITPFITEQIWQDLPKHPDWDRPISISIAQFPSIAIIPEFKRETEQWQIVQSLITETRSLRGQANLHPKQMIDLYIKTNHDLEHLFIQSTQHIKKLAQVSSISIAPDLKRPAKSLTGIGRDFEIYIPVESLLDINKELERLKKELIRVEKILSGLSHKLNNPSFVSRAPQDIINTTRAQFEKLSQQQQSLKANIHSLC